MLNPRLLSHPAARPLIYTGLLLFALWRLVPLIRAQEAMNGFDLTGSLVPAGAIEAGGPPRDGIPALDHPSMLPVSRASWLHPDDRVLGVTLGGDSRAYPVRILNWHEVVNDTVHGVPLLITYCPLCGTGMAFAAEVEGRALTFGVSGLLYNSDVLLYDRQTESLWSQVAALAISGAMKGRSLRQIPLEYTSWRDWSSRHPRGLVLDPETGYRRDYSRDPYADYRNREQIYFSVAHRDGRYPVKAPVVGLVLGGRARAWPLAELERVDHWPLRDSLNGVPLRIRYDAGAQSVTITDETGRALPAILAYWFAWVAFHPDSEVFRVSPAPPGSPRDGRAR
ncbi:MAG: DUF3179 domain-containing protein [Gammaproteobacteria bacterium]|nr:MAG: DUF3179 domain-containing protein [Gammaproteobacteria bacterium]